MGQDSFTSSPTFADFCSEDFCVVRRGASGAGQRKSNRLKRKEKGKRKLTEGEKGREIIYRESRGCMMKRENEKEQKRE